MTEKNLIRYLAIMDNKTEKEFLKDIQGLLKVIDNIRIFYVSMYEANKGGINEKF